MTTEIKTRTDDGKRVTEVEHPDGRRDVAIEVNRLDVPRETPEDRDAAEAAERAISRASEGWISVVHAPSCRHVQARGTSRKFRGMAALALESFVGQVERETGVSPDRDALAREMLVVFKVDAVDKVQVYPLRDFIAQ